MNDEHADAVAPHRPRQPLSLRQVAAALQAGRSRATRRVGGTGTGEGRGWSPTTSLPQCLSGLAVAAAVHWQARLGAALPASIPQPLPTCTASRMLPQKPAFSANRAARKRTMPPSHPRTSCPLLQAGGQ